MAPAEKKKLRIKIMQDLQNLEEAKCVQKGGLLQIL